VAARRGDMMFIALCEMVDPLAAEFMLAVSWDVDSAFLILFFPKMGRSRSVQYLG
jgi:hypothetical protein